MKAYLTDEQRLENRRISKRKSVAKYRTTEQGKLKQREYLKLDKERNPKKWKARILLKSAVKYGKVNKPTVCSVNNEDCSPGRISGHHDDYEKPLEVRWFCNNHHSEVHHGRIPT